MDEKKSERLAFIKAHGLTEKQFYGTESVRGALDLDNLTSIPDGFNPTVGWSLFLSGLTSIPDGFNPTVGGYLYLDGLTSIPDGFNPTVGVDLYLDGLTSIPEGFNPTVGGDLYLRGLTSIPVGFNPTVGGDLYLRGLTSIPEGFNPTVGGDLYLRGLTSTPEGFNPTVGEYLCLSGLTSIPVGFNPMVGGSLCLSGLTSIPDGFNPTVGGDLYLRGLTSIPEGFNPTVGGSLYLRGFNKHIGSDDPISPKLEWQDGKYIKQDGIFTEVIGRKGNVYKVRKIARKEIEYLITDGNGNWAHGSTLSAAKEDLIYKVTDRKKSDYAHLSVHDSISHEDAIRCYRVITGSCSYGTRHFVESVLCDKKQDKYTIGEIISLTKGQYRSSVFADFFNK